MMNSQGRPTKLEMVETEGHTPKTTFTGNKGLNIEEPLLFEVGDVEKSGVDLPEPEPEPAHRQSRLGNVKRKDRIGLRGLSEPEVMRHYVRLSQKNYAIDLGTYPLGSCTMKHNPRLNEKMARLPGFADVHPLQPTSTVPGALELMELLSHWLIDLTGASAVALSPRAGAHGELCGMMAIKAAHDHAGHDHKNIILVPESAHGTNPATAALLGYQVKAVPAREDGTVSVEAIRELLSPEVAGLMLTNPNTCGLFEREIVEIANAIHDVGAYFYCDGANFNAIVGKVRPIDLGVDAMHINLHKTFSTPHGGGGPGSGPVVLSEALAPFAPLPFLKNDNGTLHLVETAQEAAEHDKVHPFGRLAAFHGQMGMFVRALSYMLSHGADGVKQASEDAVLNANYVRACLQDVMTLPFGNQICMHEVLFDEKFLKDTGVSTLDFAKAMIDEGYHPMTMYFPLVVSGAMLIEPTESESKANLDQFIATLRDLVKSAKEGDVKRFKQAPELTPVKRLDETRAARSPKLRWVETEDDDAPSVRAAE